ncbi:hypothetical protein C8R48DRAFT_778238 [Suillus tomentosus]|nr:hypothetical protein C8R48DRAFT_778238 [Suillus tomentosus]
MGPECTKFCDLCQQDLKQHGWTTHRKACEKKAEKQRQNRLVVESIQREDSDAAAGSSRRPRASIVNDHTNKVMGKTRQHDVSPAWNEMDDNMGHIDPFPDTDIPERAETMFQLDDIRCEYHPSSGIPPEVHTFHTFKRCPTPSTPSVPPDKQPWTPFKSRLEFELAELALEACLNNEQTDRLIKLCNRCTSRQEKFTFQTHKDIRDRWDTTSHRITGFTQDVISVPYDGTVREFKLHYRNLWEWATNLLRDPQLFPHMIFDAQRFSKFDGKTFVNFLDEPYTAEAFWNIQSQLPEGAKPLAFILYTNKTKLSSFGTARGYPVVARLANLPTDICNGEGIGGGYIVGWLPIVKEEKDHTGKPSWVNFKNTVWHEAFLKILSLLASKSSTGQWFECLDSIQRWFFPPILFLSANYEEHLGREKVAQMDHNYKVFPRWRNLKHLAQVMSISFTDGSVYEAISKACFLMVIFAAHAIVTEDECPLGYLLLRCIRLFLEVDMYAALEVHTTDTIHAGRHVVQAFSTYLQQYITKTADESDKNWNFPKLHMSVHIFDNIEAKGVTSNYNTKPNEKMHGSLKESYLMRTNFRDIAPQILCINHWQVIAESICWNISDFDKYQSQNVDYVLDEDESLVDDLVISNDSPHVKLGSRQAPQTFESLENAHKSDSAFTNFHIKLNEFLTNFLLAIQLPLPGGKRVQLKTNDKITECHFLKVNYESLVDWRQHTDYLQCNPKFFGASRFDCAFIQTTDTIIFGRLLFVFKCTLDNTVLSLALIHPFDAPTGMHIRKDKHLNIFCVREKLCTQAKFFSVRAIIRGALLVPDGGNDFLVVDTVDTDMFLHVKALHLEAGHIVRV